MNFFISVNGSRPAGVPVGLFYILHKENCILN